GPILRVASFAEDLGIFRGIVTQLMIENVTVVVFLPFGDFALFRVTRVPETGVVELPSDAGRTCALNGVGQQLSARNVDHVQRAQLRAAGRGAISEQLSIVRGLPPIKCASA